MNAERLLAHYEQIADAPDAIGRLRRFILDLAVRGKLVPQGPKDEPASELLNRIALEKRRLAKAGEIKAEKSLPPVGDDADFDVPSNWRWTRLGVVTSYIQRGKSPKYATSDGTAVVSQKCVQWVGLDLTVAKQVTKESLAEYESIRFIRDSDLLWNSTGTGTIGRVIRVVQPPEKLVCDSHVTIVRCLTVDPEYIRSWLRSDRVYGQVEDRAAGSTNQVELTAYMAINQVVPLPPLAEQHRIVAKVDELMALCDRLEAARAEREATRDRLAASSLARLNAPDPGTFQADARFVLNALPALTTRTDQIKQLRQTILNLAVRGKLVPGDEGELIKEIELESLVKIVRGSSPRPKGDPRYYGGPVPRLLIADITRDGKYVTPQIDNLTIAGAKLSRPMSKGSLVLAISGSYGVPAFLAVDACIHDGFIGFRDVSPIVDPQYLYLIMQFRRPYFDDVVKDSGLKNLTTEHLKRLTVPLYPIAVQRRIVAKVDELMALCDRLEASLTDTAATRRRLLDALLAEALEPAEVLELEATA